MASIVLALYGYEALAVPLATAALSESPQQVEYAAAESIYVLYVPQQGERATEVAQRFAVSESVLAAMRAQVRAYGWSDRAWLVPKGSAGEAALYPGYVLYTLKKGERLASVALRVNRSERELARLNALVMGDAAVAGLTAGDMVLLPAPQAKSAKTDPLAKKENGAFAQKLTQNLTQAAQGYGSAQKADSGQSVGDVLAQQAAAGASTALSQSVEELLNPYGRARVGVRTNTETNDVDIEFDYLHPLLESDEDILFGQVGARTFDERNIGNVGVGYRKQVSPNLMLGANAFVDQDFSNNHTRGGVGIEAWTDDARLAANAYAPLSGWKDSNRDELNTDTKLYDLYERPASGWDVRAEAALPGAPKLAGTLKYFQWKGEGVDALGGGQLEKNPKGYAVGVKWQPIPLVGFTAEHQQIQGGDSNWQVGASLSWSFDLSLDKQLNPANAIALKPLSEARKDFVQREYNVVLDYKQKDKKTGQTVPFAFVTSSLTLLAPAATDPNPVVSNSPSLLGVLPAAVLRFEKGPITPSHLASRVVIDTQTGALTVPPGTSARSVKVYAYQQVNGQDVASTHYDLLVEEPGIAPGHPIVDVTDITGMLQVGQTLTGVYSFDANGGNTTDASALRWINGGQTDSDANYLLNASDVGRVLTFEVEAVNGAGLTGNIDRIDTATAGGVSGGGTAPPGSVIDPAAGTPIVDVTDITGVLQVGQTLTGVYSFDANGGDATNASTMQWLNGGQADSDANYLLNASDVGRVLTFEVTAVNGAAVTGNTDSIDTATAAGVSGGGTTPPGSVIDPAAGLPFAVQVTGEVNGFPQVGSPLTATPTCIGACGPVSYQWQLETAVGSNTFVDIPGAVSSIYVPVKGDQIRKILVIVN